MPRADDFLRAVHRSRSLHRGLASPPRTLEQYRAYVARLKQPTHRGHFLCLPGGAIAGVVNINEIVEGGFKSGYLGYYAFQPHHGQGHLAAGLELVVARAFRTYRLHRLEANIQPSNARSIALVRNFGFRLEGVSPRYLKIAGRWRDHERWAITIEDWRQLTSERNVLSAHRRSPLTLEAQPL